MGVKALSQATEAAQWLKAAGAKDLCADSRRLQAGDAFVAWPGYGQDARQYVTQALSGHAVAALVEAQGLEQWAFGPTAAVASMTGLKAQTGEVAHHFYGCPSEHMAVIAVTGTNGKTSTTWWLSQALGAVQRPCGIIGTLGVAGQSATAGGGWAKTGLTTPDPLTLHQSLAAMRAKGMTACAMEASSIGLAEHRMAGLQVKVAVLTNFTQDHLDYHGSMDAYWAVKAELFAWPGLAHAVINVDDARGQALASHWPAGGAELWTYAIDRPARLMARDVSYRDGGLQLTVREGDTSVHMTTGLIGQFNVSNLLAVLASLRALGLSLAQAVVACEHLTPVPGRMQRIQGRAQDPEVVVDYAHTPDALDKALQALQPLVTARGGRLWCVFGCGGNRDAAKRPLMGALAEQRADHVVITSDNPRMEAPGDITQHIVKGLRDPGRAVVMLDRREAIRHAVAQASPRDVVLIAGKGHETEQDIAGVKTHFSDAQEAQAALAARLVAQKGVS